MLAFSRRDKEATRSMPEPPEDADDGAGGLVRKLVAKLTAADRAELLRELQERAKDAADDRYGEMFAAMIADCEAAWGAGSAEAVSVAVTMCNAFRRPPPLWLAHAVAEMVFRGQSKSEAQRRRFDYVHVLRWRGVVELREDGVSWERAFEAVSEASEGTFVAGAPDSVKKSYALVERDLGEGRWAKYAFFMGRKSADP
jgi:hypothetical protein